MDMWCMQEPNIITSYINRGRVSGISTRVH